MDGDGTLNMKLKEIMTTKPDKFIKQLISKLKSGSNRDFVTILEKIIFEHSKVDWKAVQVLIDEYDKKREKAKLPYYIGYDPKTFKIVDVSQTLMRNMDTSKITWINRTHPMYKDVLDKINKVNDTDY